MNPKLLLNDKHLYYANGKGVAKDFLEAVKWFRKAAEQGDEDAKSALRRLGVGLNE